LCCEVIVVSANRLGTINHTLLTVRALLSTSCRGARKTCSPIFTHDSTHLKVVLMNHASGDASSNSNAKILAEFLTAVPLFAIPFLGRNCRSINAVKRNQKKLQKNLARILQ
jgi:dethiobiotin synthetase